MISPRQVRVWYRIHKWTSLLCTLFLLISCITGLPLIFHDEIDHLMNPSEESRPPIEIPLIPLAKIVQIAQASNPSLHPIFVSVEEDEPHVNVGMANGPDPATAKQRRLLVFNAYTGEPVQAMQPDETVMDKVLLLHRRLFAGTPGELFMGLMALQFVIALISGALVYGPFMRRLDFGTVRKDKSPRIYWLDIHNMLGIVTLCWALVVGATGIMNALSTPLFAIWQKSAMPELLTPYHGKPPVTNIITPDAAAAIARRALPEMKVTGIVFPNPIMSSPHHFLVYTKGRTPVTSRLFTPVLIEAETGQIAMARPFPWYIRALEVSRPLHFGDYGGLPLKILWALFDFVLILVLISGVYLWFSRRSLPFEEALNQLVEEKSKAVVAESAI